MTFRHFYIASGALAAAIGIAHTGVGLLGGRPLDQSRMWFVGSGLYMVLSAALAMLDASAQRPSAAWGLLVRCNNAVILVFAIATGLLGRPTLVEWLLVVTAFGGMALSALVGGRRRSDRGALPPR